jgi:plastocyanin
LLLMVGALGSAATAWEVSAASRAVNTVTINQFRYQPETLTVQAGDVVIWKNVDMVPHTATAVDGKAFDSGVIDAGAEWRFTAARKGTHQYLCTFHPNMKATLVVK